ncbi:MAG: ABC transporter ATP-binding protein [Gemmatimonadales bacterium]
MLLWVAKLLIETIEQALLSSAAPDVGRLAILLLLEFAVAFAGEALGKLAGLLDGLLVEAVSTELSVKVMAHAATLDLAQLEDHQTYNQLERAREEVAARVAGAMKLIDTAQAALSLGLMIAALVAYLPWLLLLLAVSVLPSFFGALSQAEAAYALVVRWTPRRRRLNYLRWLATNADTAKEVKLLGLAPLLIERYEREARQSLSEHRVQAIAKTGSSIGFGAIGAAGYYGALAIIVYLTVSGYVAAAGPFTIGVLTFLAASFRESRGLIQRLLLSLAGIYEESRLVADLFSFLELRPVMRVATNGPVVARSMRQGLVLERVGFCYPGSTSWVLRGVDLAIQPGERVAIVGENGAGKTTLVKLLTRLYDPNEGRVLLDGRDLRDYDLADLRSRVAVSFQDHARLAFTVGENIGVGAVKHLEDVRRIRCAAEKGLAWPIVERLPRGLDQQLGRQFEEGVDLSGGEWQKVALSRSYMRDAAVLVLDEPTAALDPRAESHVFQRVVRATGAQIVVVISHRFSTVRAADRIVVLGRGTVLENGSHDKLVAQGGTYAELYELQASAYR